MSPDLLFELGLGCLIVGALAAFGLFVLGLCEMAGRTPKFSEAASAAVVEESRNG